jgi:hypothetical protein
MLLKVGPDLRVGLRSLANSQRQRRVNFLAQSNGLG